MKKYPLGLTIGHRGVPQRLPENSLEGFELAADLGYRWCEVDVQEALDGVAMLHHNFSLGTAGAGYVRDHLGADLAQKVVGVMPDSGAEVRLPSLAACLELAHARQLCLVVEIKARDWEYESAAIATANAIKDGPQVEMLVSSFGQEALREIHELLPEMPLALNTGALPKSVPPMVANVHFNYRQAHPGAIGFLKNAGLGLYAYTVNKKNDRDRLLKMGVDGVFTDNPDVLLLEDGPGA